MTSKEMIQERIGHLRDISEVLTKLADITHSMLEEETIVDPEIRERLMKLLVDVQTLIAEIWIEGPATENA